MRMRMGAPRTASALLVALVSLLAATRTASAANCGACGYSNLKSSCCDAQCCFSANQEQNKVVYKLVVSNTLDRADWRNSGLISGDVAGQIGALKAQSGKNINVSGSPIVIAG